MNMILHDDPAAVTVQGNTLADPKFIEGGALKTLDYVVANPPPAKPYLFQPGNSGGPGRPKGARAKLSELFLSAMCADFEKNGIEAIRLARIADPMGYVKSIAGILPKELTGEDGGALVMRIERVIIDPKN